MPALPDQPNVLRIDHDFSIGSDASALVRWHYTYSGGAPSDANCVSLAASIYAAWVTACIALLGDDNYIDGVRVTDLTSPTSGQGVHTASTVGTRSGDPLPAGAAVLVNMPIGRRYRGGKPRSYWPFFTGSDLASPQTWLSGSVTAVAGALEAYDGALESLTAGTTDLAALVSISYYEGFTIRPTPPIAGVRAKNIPTPRSVAIAPDVILALNVSGRVASQRRRNQQA